MNVVVRVQLAIACIARSALHGTTLKLPKASSRIGNSLTALDRTWHLNQRAGFRHSLTTWSSSQSSNDTIYALSTAPGRAAIAVIRISGPACLEVYQGLCPQKPLPKPRTATLRRLHGPRESNHLPVLDSGALVLYFPAPRTVTGEDLLELHVHGGPAIVKAVLEAIPDCSNTKNIRYADPGEFTRRAFYNERLDLTQVEALGDVLAAETEQQRRLAVNGAANSLSTRYEEWRKMLLHARGELEALIDFSEDQHFDESPAEFMASVTDQVVQLKGQIQLHIINASKGELLRSGINLALLGAPNAGKSSLLNLIVGREAAIVSSEAGTTRDIVDVSVDIGGWLCRLGDTAGLRNDLSLSTSDQSSVIGTIEKEGIRRAKARAIESDVIIAVLSYETNANSEPILHIDPEVASAIQQCKEAGKAIIIALNKIDRLDPSINKDLTSILTAQASSEPLQSILRDLSPSKIVPISCHTASRLLASSTTPTLGSVHDPGNIQQLLQTLTTTFSTLTTPSADGSLTHDRSYWEHSLSVSHRQATNLRQCLIHLEDFLAGSGNVAADLDPSLSLPVPPETDEVDIVAGAEHLRFAANCLAKITGKDEAGDVESVLGVVFENFCVGK